MEVRTNYAVLASQVAIVIDIRSYMYVATYMELSYYQLPWLYIHVASYPAI